MSGNKSYDINEIRYNIDTAIELAMFNSDKSLWDALRDVKARLYDEFGIDD
jgi:hypothetical protein